MPTNKKSDDDLFDAIVFRDTAGAPRSFGDYSAYSSASKRSQGNAISVQSHPRSRTTSAPHNTNDVNPKTNVNANVNTDVDVITPLRPKVAVKIFVHEEVSSTQDKKNALDEVSSHVLLDGAVHAKVSSSAAASNPPFAIRIIDPDYPEDTNFQFDTNFMTIYGGGKSEYNTLSVPRAVREQFKIASYCRSVTKKFMPVLVQSKVVRFGDELESCKILIQIRSNLNNVGNLQDITVAVAIPPTVLSKSLKITAGENGAYDELKRVIKWKVGELSQGNSVAFGAEVKVAGASMTENGSKKKNRKRPIMMADELPRFPVLLRCSSVQDTVSSIQVDCRELEDGRHPVDIDVTMQRSFKLLHRLPP